MLNIIIYRLIFLRTYSAMPFSGLEHLYFYQTMPAGVDVLISPHSSPNSYLCKTNPTENVYILYTGNWHMAWRVHHVFLTLQNYNKMEKRPPTYIIIVVLNISMFLEQYGRIYGYNDRSWAAGVLLSRTQILYKKNSILWLGPNIIS